ncbi:TPA: hypothetical protein ACPSKY_003453 [Legionella bozemanae]|uniref:Coiled-coil protein n=1 Tax=Legionella bozemanae TaxID=447 RepID=A0A0W0RT92_LEGBO|nr:hypothetical protein [Legionella bozemanae]KTC74261.1 hypothetical protein Lboz_1701 [Legionella bozemanae]STO33853.1 Uncharacterised protein [Legionella bozemanae]
MDRDAEVLEIYHRNISKEEKIHLLEEMALDLRNEMEAQDQNMHPEIHNKLAEGLRLATNFIRELQSLNKS